MASVIYTSLVERPRFMWAVLPKHRGHREREEVRREACGVVITLVVLLGPWGTFFR